MRPKTSSAKKPAEQVVMDIRRATTQYGPAGRMTLTRLQGLAIAAKTQHGTAPIPLTLSQK